MYKYENRYVNGPYNIVRLEGKVGTVKKVIYIFFDYHAEVTEQTECLDIFSKDIQTFFAYKFYDLNKQNKMYDFFFEILHHPIDIKFTEKRKDKYIHEIYKFFVKLFQYDKEKNKVDVNNIFKNIRFHYIDIREYYHYNIGEIFYNILHNYESMPKNDFISAIDVIIESIYFTIDLLSNYQNKSNYEKIKTKSVEEDDFKYFIYKIRNKYSNKNIQDVLNSYLDDVENNLKKTVEKIQEIKSKFVKLYDFYEKHMDGKIVYIKEYNYAYHKIPREIYMEVDLLIFQIADVSNIILGNYTRITDIYSLRRFLDKKYITNTISYTGGNHSINMIEILTKKFGFKITNAFFNRYENIDKLNNKIHDLSNVEIKYILSPDYLQQCSSLEGFPDNFE
jgi:hypothetical protein